MCAYHTIMTYVKQLSGKSYCVNVSPGKNMLYLLLFQNDCDGKLSQLTYKQSGVSQLFIVLIVASKTVACDD